MHVGACLQLGQAQELCQMLVLHRNKNVRAGELQGHALENSNALTVG